MKKLTLIALSFILSNAAFSQILSPVKWSYAAKKINNEQAIIFIKATIDKGWHIYSQHIEGEGPKTLFKFEKSDDYTLVGNTIEPKPLSRYEKAFKLNVGYFEQSVVFQQKVKLKNQQTSVNGSVNFLVCSNKECLPPEDVEFKISLK